jgi:hypothetical protein
MSALTEDEIRKQREAYPPMSPVHIDTIGKAGWVIAYTAPHKNLEHSVIVSLIDPNVDPDGALESINIRGMCYFKTLETT